MNENKKTLSGTSLVGGTVDTTRVDNDFYATNPKSVRTFLDNHKIESDSFYEPCCGQGHISKVLKEYFPEAQHYATDLVDRGYGIGGIDFLENGQRATADWIVTNPPYSLAKEFVDESLKCANKGVAMFLKIQFLEGQVRKDWFKTTPLKYVYVFSARQDTWNDGQELNPKTGKKWANTMCFAWFVWEHNYTGEPIVRWI
jgi:hypothetical protein